jgi:hypothetical protein
MMLSSAASPLTISKEVSSTSRTNRDLDVRWILLNVITPTWNANASETFSHSPTNLSKVRPF